MSQPLLAAVGIFKNEAHSIQRTLESIKPFIDSWHFLDTGSTDGTPDVIRQVMEGTSGTLSLGDFSDYAQSRNKILDLQAGEINPAKHTLMISGDEVLVGGDRLRSFLAGFTGTDGAFLLEIRTEKDSCLFPRVLRTGSPWRYEGEVQERPVNRVDKIDPSIQIPGVAIEHQITDPARRMRRVAEVDIPTLTKIVINRETDLPTRQRSLLLLAQAYETIARAMDPSTPGGEWTNKMFLSLGLYARRVEAGGDVAEVEEAHMHFLNVMEALGLYDDEEMLKRLSHLENSRLPEIHFMIAAHIARLDATAGYDRAVAAARLTKAALEQLTMRPVNREILWQSHRIAAHCARAIGRADDAKKSALAGIEAGGNPQLFTEFLVGASS